MTEYWKDIEGFEGLYQVSNLGRVKSLKYNKEKILKPGKSSNGYLYVTLHKNGNGKSYRVNRLVAQAFIHNPNFNYYTVVNHKDENRLNNNADNLEWCNYKYNNNYGSRNERISKSMINNIKFSRAVIGINNINGYIVEYPSTREAERVMGICHQNITKCCQGKLKSAGGYKWIYVNNEEVKENE